MIFQLAVGIMSNNKKKRNVLSQLVKYFINSIWMTDITAEMEY